MRQITIPDDAWVEWVLRDIRDSAAVGSYSTYEAACEAGTRWMGRDPKVRAVVDRVTTWSEEGRAIRLSVRFRMLPTE